jgi:hypothetical protein
VPADAASSLRYFTVCGQTAKACALAMAQEAVDLYWLPLGAGGHVVRLNGWAYEILMARIERRPAYDLYHSAHQAQVPKTDVAEAVDSPRQLTGDEQRARRVLDVVAQVPTPVWGRDELGTGEMWNSNSAIAWVIASSGRGRVDSACARGRAPGWQSGLDVARRHEPPAQSAATADSASAARWLEWFTCPPEPQA